MPGDQVECTQRWDDDTRALSFGIRYQGERNGYRQRSLLNLHVKHLGHDLIVGDDDGFIEVELVVRVLAVAASGERARLDVDLAVVHLLDAVAMQVILVVFGEDLADDTFFSVEVKRHLVGIVFLSGLRKDWLSDYLTRRIGHSLGEDGMFLEVEFDIIGLHLDVVVFYDGAAIVENLVVFEILNGGVVTGTVDLGLQRRFLVLTSGDDRKNHHKEEKNKKKAICRLLVQDFYLIL